MAQNQNDLKHWNEKEQALRVILEELIARPQIIDSEQFPNALKLIIQSLSESGISVYLQAVEVVNELFKASLQINYDYLFQNFEEIVTPMMLKSADSNTRVRQKTSECINNLWTNLLTSINPKFISKV